MGNSLTKKSDWQATGRTALITGASGGIGAELARAFAREGASLALVARNLDNLRSVAQECQDLGAPKVQIYSCDVTSSKDLEVAIKKAIEDLKGFDVVVLNAGRSQGCYFEEICEPSQIDYMLQLNVGGVLNTLHYLLPAIFKSQNSRIVVISSTAGLIPVPYRTVYCASKAALVGFSNSLRMELLDTYGNDTAPKVSLINFPEVRGTSLNAGRMDFGAKQEPVRFREETAQDLKLSVAECMEAIRQGRREWGQPLKVKLLLPLYSIIPSVLERVIMKHVKATHYQPAALKSSVA